MLFSACFVFYQQNNYGLIYYYALMLKERITPSHSQKDYSDLIYYHRYTADASCGITELYTYGRISCYTAARIYGNSKNEVPCSASSAY